MEETFNALYQSALLCGVNPIAFWNYTYGEIIDIINTDREMQKKRIENNYNLAFMIAMFNNKANNGKSPPPIQELFPQLFAPKAEDDNSWIIVKEQMLDYAEMIKEKRR